MDRAAFELTLQIVLTVIAGIGAQVLADYLRLPSIVFLLLFGMCFSYGIGLFSFCVSIVLALDMHNSMSILPKSYAHNANSYAHFAQS